MLEFERQFWDRGVRRIAGVDEAGRGPLAGPVVAGAVVLDPDFAILEESGVLSIITDSKKLTPAKREKAFAILWKSPSVEIGVGRADVDEIDRLNILNATHLAMSRALEDLDHLPEHVLVDGLEVKSIPCESTPIVRGDSKSLSVAAASIVAKVIRDGIMKELDLEYPRYGFARHKGYGTSYHTQALFEHGPCPIHRRSFRPVREAEEIRARVHSVDLKQSESEADGSQGILFGDDML